MTIHKADNYIEAYRAKAHARDINELSGRPGRPDLTDYIGRAILDAIPLERVAMLVDVGCGQGSLLLEAVTQGRIQRGVGILPTYEEATRVREYLRTSAVTDGQSIEILQGTAAMTGLPASSADLVVCNGVFVLLYGPNEITQALTEFFRIMRPGAILYLGEIPDKDEFANKSYGDSILRWLAWVLRHQGWRRFFAQTRSVAMATISKEPFVVAPKRVFFEAPEAFQRRLREHGFELFTHGRHHDIGTDRSLLISPTRWNYLVRKPLGR